MMLFFTLSRKIFLFILVIKFLVTRDSPYVLKWLPYSEINCKALIQRDKVKWVRVTLIEGYLKAADRSSTKIPGS